MSSIITGLFASSYDAARAVHSVEAKGIAPNKISLIANETFDRESFAITDKSKLPEGVALGAGSGGTLGAIVAGLTAVGTIATGGAGVLAAGPIVAALAGGGAGALAGGLLGGAIGAAIPEHEIKHVEDSIEKGSVLVGVEVDDSDAKECVKDLFEACDAKKISHA